MPGYRRELITQTFQSIDPMAVGIKISFLRDISSKVGKDHPLAEFVHDWSSATKSIALDQFFAYYHVRLSHFSITMVCDNLKTYMLER